MKYTGVMLQEEKNPIGKMACFFWMFFYQRKEYLPKVNLIFLSCSTALYCTCGYPVLNCEN